MHKVWFTKKHQLTTTKHQMFKSLYTRQHIIEEVAPDTFIIEKPKKAQADRVYQVSERFYEDALMLSEAYKPFFETRKSKRYCKLIGGESLENITLINDILNFNYSVYELKEKVILNEIGYLNIAKRIKLLEHSKKEYQLKGKLNSFDLIIRVESLDKSEKTGKLVSEVVSDNLVAVFFLVNEKWKRTVLVK